MRKLISYSFAASLLVISSCSEDIQNTENHLQSSGLIDIQGNAIATIEIEGMMCELGCGAEIRKHLKESGSVVSCSFDFDEDRKVNTANIVFDNRKIDANELAKLIRQIDDKRFKTGKISAKAIETSMSAPCSNNNKAGGGIVSVTESTLAFPNLFEFIGGFGL